MPTTDTDYADESLCEEIIGGADLEDLADELDLAAYADLAAWWGDDEEEDGDDADD